MLISKVPIYVIFDGPVRNFSAIISLLSYKCFMHEKSNIEFDYIRQDVYSPKHSDSVKNTMLERKYVMELLTQFSKMPKSLIDRMFTERIYIDSKTALKYGLCSEIIKDCYD